MTGVFLGKVISVRVSPEVDNKAKILAKKYGGISTAYRTATMMLYQQNSKTHEKAQKLLEQHPHIYKSVSHVYEIAILNLNKKHKL